MGKKLHKTQEGEYYRTGSIVIFTWSYMQLGQKQTYTGKVDEYTPEIDFNNHIGVWAVNDEGKERRFSVERHNIVKRLKF